MDHEDKTLKINFVDNEKYTIDQWWPWGSVEIYTETGDHYAQMVIDSVNENGATEAVEAMPSHVKERIETSLEAAGEALKTSSQQQIRELADCLAECCHGNPPIECGKCPRPDLTAGSVVKVAAKEATPGSME